MALLQGKILVGRSLTKSLESLNIGHQRSLKRDLLECPLLNNERTLHDGKENGGGGGGGGGSDYAALLMMLYKRVAVQWEKMADVG